MWPYPHASRVRGPAGLRAGCGGGPCHARRPGTSHSARRTAGAARPEDQAGAVLPLAGGSFGPVGVAGLREAGAAPEGDVVLRRPQSGRLQIAVAMPGLIDRLVRVRMFVRCVRWSGGCHEVRHGGFGPVEAVVGFAAREYGSGDADPAADRGGGAVGGKFNGAGKVAFDDFKTRSDEITKALNASLSGILGGQAGMDAAFGSGDQEQDENAKTQMASANFDAARFGGR